MVFVEAVITCPKDIKIPLLMHNYDGKNIHPTGTWTGVYFSEELKAAIKHGYEVEILWAYQFTRVKDYVWIWLNVYLNYMIQVRYKN